MQTFKIPAFFLLAFILASCNSDVVFKKFEQLSPKVEWKRDNKISFHVPIKDIVPKHQFTVAIRFIAGYPYQNLKLNLATISPSGVQATETIVIPIRNEKGENMGSCMGDLCDFEYVFKHDVIFNEVGEYVFIAEHAMDQPTLTHVMDLGLIVQIEP